MGRKGEKPTDPTSIGVYTMLKQVTVRSRGGKTLRKYPTSMAVAILHDAPELYRLLKRATAGELNGPEGKRVGELLDYADATKLSEYDRAQE